MVLAAKSSETSARGGQILRLERSLGPAQIERRERLLLAARGLASEGGYAAVTIRDVADRAGMSLATVYRYFSSKDHLIAEVHSAEGAAVSTELERNPPEGVHGQDRVLHFFEVLVDIVVNDLNLASAGVMAWSSGDPGASSSAQWHSGSIGPCIEAAYGDEDVGDREEICEILGHLVFSVMVGLTNGRLDSGRANQVLATAVRRLLPREN